MAAYKESVRAARDLTFVLLYPDEENSASKNSPGYESDVTAKIRRTLPASETVQWSGANIEIDNRWLFDELAEFEKEPADSPKREEILAAVGERLDAIKRQIEELENTSAAAGAKDENKQKLAEILRREEYRKPEKPEASIFQKIYRKIIEWLMNFFPQPNLSSSESGGFQSLTFVLQILLYALVFGAIGFLIYKFAPFLTNRFRRTEKTDKKERIILGEKLHQDQTSKDIFEEAEKLARDGNLRGAIRKGYIALLCELGDRKIIALSQHKTNRDYLRDVRSKNELYRSMNGLTLNFERHWYGSESAEEKDWEEFRQDYQRTVNMNR